jgi:hypothetical protein
MKQTEKQFYVEQKVRLNEIEYLVNLYLMYKAEGNEYGIARVEKQVDAMLAERGL